MQFSSYEKATIDAINSKVLELETAIDGVNTAVGGINTAVGGINTAVDELKNTDLSNVSTKIDSILTSVDGVATEEFKKSPIIEQATIHSTVSNSLVNITGQGGYLQEIWQKAKEQASTYYGCLEIIIDGVTIINIADYFTCSQTTRDVGQENNINGLLRFNNSLVINHKVSNTSQYITTRALYILD
jgi:hypothetical protein